MSTLCILIILFTLGFLYFFDVFDSKTRKKLKLVCKIPGPKGLPIIANLFLIFTPMGKNLTVFESHR